jgi:hypothetical protein
MTIKSALNIEWLLFEPHFKLRLIQNRSIKF